MVCYAPVFPGGDRNNLQLVELNGVLYGGWGHDSGTYHPRLVGILPVRGRIGLVLLGALL
jgi:hypothetical protein